MSFSDHDRLTKAQARIDAARAMRVPHRPAPAMPAMDEQSDDVVVSAFERSAATPVVGRLQNLQPPRFSDDDLANQFVVQADKNLRWSPGLGWMLFNGTIWSRDKSLYHYELARLVCRAAAASVGVDKETEAKRIASAKTRNAVVALAQADRSMVVPVQEWDATPMLLNTPAGIVDLQTGQIRGRDLEYLTQAVAIAPDFHTDLAPVWWSS